MCNVYVVSGAMIVLLWWWLCVLWGMMDLKVCFSSIGSTDRRGDGSVWRLGREDDQLGLDGQS